MQQSVMKRSDELFCWTALRVTKIFFQAGSKLEKRSLGPICVIVCERERVRDVDEKTQI